MEKTLFLELFQPFAQYRNPFTFYYAQSFPLPPRSAIIGMLQNATGDWYGNTMKLENFWVDLKISVHGGFESVFWNYQSLIKGDTVLNDTHLQNDNLPLYGYGQKSQRSPVNQQELFNGHLYIFLKGEEHLIDIIAESLNSPRKILYLGRSEDIIFIKAVTSVKPQESKVAQKEIWMNRPAYIKSSFPIKTQSYPVFSIPVTVTFENNGVAVTSKSQITKETLRRSKFETVIYAGYDYMLKLKEGSKVEVETYKIESVRDADNQPIRFKIPVDYGWL